MSHNGMASVKFIRIKFLYFFMLLVFILLRITCISKLDK